MANEGNLKPFKKGEDERRNVTGENAGSKHRRTVARWVLELVAVLPDDKQDEIKKLIPSLDKNMTAEEIGQLLTLYRWIVEGNDIAGKNLLDSAYGAPKQEIDQTVSGHIAINIDNQDAKLGE
jgi:hypothetical protein